MNKNEALKNIAQQCQIFDTAVRLEKIKKNKEAI